MSNLMLDIKVSSLIQITDGINVPGFEFKVDLKIVRNTSGHYQEKFSISWSTHQRIRRKARIIRVTPLR